MGSCEPHVRRPHAREWAGTALRRAVLAAAIIRYDDTCASNILFSRIAAPEHLGRHTIHVDFLATACKLRAVQCSQDCERATDSPSNPLLSLCPHVSKHTPPQPITLLHPLPMVIYLMDNTNPRPRPRRTSLLRSLT